MLATWVYKRHRTNGRISSQLATGSSIRIRQWYGDDAPNYFVEFGAGKRFWQPKYYAFQVHSEAKLKEKLNYMHLNPVRAALVERAVDWAWSSARWYIERRSVGVKVEWVEC